MARIKLENMDMGVSKKPVSDPLHDTQTLLNRSLGTESDDYRAIPLTQITVNPENDYSREDTDEDIRELALDIERNGLLHNIVVSAKPNENGYMILSGERRFRAYQWLHENRNENRYSLILCKVLTGLDALDEMLVLDAANLQTRGSMADERRYRKATLRFLDNLKRKGGISEEEAKALTVRYTGTSEQLLEKNIAVERNLHADIKKLLDSGLLPKNQAYAYARLPDEIQSVLAENLNSAYERGTAELHDANERLADATKTITDLNARIEMQEKKIREVDEDISEAQLSLDALNAMTEEGENPEEMAEQMGALKKTLTELEMQKRVYTSTITSARAALRKSEQKLSDMNGTQTKTGKPSQDDSASFVNKTVKRAESDMTALSSRTTMNRMRRMDATGRAVMLERLRDIRASLDATISALEQVMENGDRK